MKLIKTKIPDLLILKSQVFKDKRGFLKETFRKDVLNKNLPFDVMSYSKKNVLRGLHFQSKYSQAKLITVTHGKILDVAVDLRKNSKTFGKYFSIIINQDDDFSFFIPENFAHGFLCLSKSCTINYKCSNYRNQKYERTLAWNDPHLNINWHIKNPLLSDKDKNKNQTFKELFFKS
ncbi:dTDP-4-dehydrorhamnose 3,5-epimerase [Candidatus Pelagibacter sp. Uisw_134_02]|uniref:dTDP-4-dehydrorhamnose 3,5-epimerase n=1 Tax=Candidatus Pelagibacter sp. Uisw_134_02 TaxID=3230990 RepID=UPI0039E8AF2B